MFHVEQQHITGRSRVRMRIQAVVGASALLISAAGAWAAPTKVAIPGSTSSATSLALTGYWQPAASKDLAPAIILMHGCSGLYYRGGKRAGEITASYQDWADRLHAAGYHVLQLDSFGPRAQQEICTQSPQPIKADVDRPRDAHQALGWVAKQPGVDAKRVHLIGWSNGGTAVLNANVPDAYGRGEFGKGLGFRSVVAFYPGCAQLAKVGYTGVAPTLIQAGGADDWTPASFCADLAKAKPQASASIEIDVYEGAHHAFDRLAAPIRFRKDVNRGKGATVGTHPEARAEAIAKTLSFLSKNSQASHRHAQTRND